MEYRLGMEGWSVTLLALTVLPSPTPLESGGLPELRMEAERAARELSERGVEAEALSAAVRSVGDAAEFAEGFDAVILVRGFVSDEEGMELLRALLDRGLRVPVIWVGEWERGFKGAEGST
ncbi:MAG: hypothetical protein DRO06_02365 [Thermoproteota archaeon]|nr:MAG: hypothetical protein DRO06_02365 [Candidatus Korarchaeota archaeon]